MMGCEMMSYLPNKIGFMFPTGTGIPTRRVAAASKRKSRGMARKRQMTDLVIGCPWIRVRRPLRMMSVHTRRSSSAQWHIDGCHAKDSIFVVYTHCYRFIIRLLWVRSLWADAPTFCSSSSIIMAGWGAPNGNIIMWPGRLKASKKDDQAG